MQASGEVLPFLQEKFKLHQKDAQAETVTGTAASSLPADEVTNIFHTVTPGEAMRAIDAGALKAAILELSEGSSVGALAAHEGAICARFGVQAFASLGHAPTLLQVGLSLAWLYIVDVKSICCNFFLYKKCKGRC